jgi:hypothetical protein
MSPAKSFRLGTEKFLSVWRKRLTLRSERLAAADLRGFY